MFNENNIDKLIKNLDPDKLQEEKMRDVVFSRLGVAQHPSSKKIELAKVQSQNSLSSIIMEKFSFVNKKFAYAALGITGVVFFVGLPLISSQMFGVRKATMNSDSLTGAEIAENPTSTDYSYTNDVIGNVQEKVRDIIYGGKEQNSVTSEDTEKKETERAKEKKGFLDLLVEDVSAVVGKIYELTQTIEGYVVSSNVDKDGDYGEGNVIIRIPSEKFDYVMSELRKMSVRILAETSNIIDVQNEITESNNTLAQLRTQLNSKYEALKTASASAKASIEYDIKQLENQIAAEESVNDDLVQRASFSTITIEMSENEDVAKEDNSILATAKKVLSAAQTIAIFWVKTALWILVLIPAVMLPAGVIGCAYWIGKKIVNKVRNLRK